MLLSLPACHTGTSKVLLEKLVRRSSVAFRWESKVSVEAGSRKVLRKSSGKWAVCFDVMLACSQ